MEMSFRTEALCRRQGGARPERWAGLVLALLVSAAQAQTTYYVSPNGDDGNPGTQVDPWATIEKVNQEIGSGITVLFERGGLYRGAVDVPVFSTNVTVGAYGTGELPTLTGNQSLGGTWTQWQGDVYRQALELDDPGDRVKHVYVNGVRMESARHPSVGWFHTISANEDEIVSADMDADEDEWNDAEVVIRYRNWGYELGTIASTTATTLTLQTAVPNLNGTGPGWGFFIRNSLNALDAEGEWFHDGEWLYLWAPGGGTPTGVEYMVEYAVDNRNQGVRSSDTENLTIRDLDIRHRPKAGISLNSASNATVENCVFEETFTGIGGDGGNSDPNDQGIIRGNVFRNIHDRAIRVSQPRLSIEDNDIAQTGLWPGLGGTVIAYEGLLSGGADCVIQNNVLRDIGYTGIAAGGDRTLVEHNRVERAGRILNDVAGITMDDCDQLIVRRNIVTDMRSGLEERLESVSPEIDEYGDITFGIYFGNRPITNSLVEHNVVAACGAGIHVDHNADVLDLFDGGTAGNVVRYNTLFNNTVQLSLSDFSNCSSIPGSDNCIGALQGEGGVNLVGSFDTEYTGNIMYGLSSAQRCMQLQHVYASDASERVVFGDFSDNRYFNPFNDVVAYERVFYEVSGVTQYLGETVIPHTLKGWQASILSGSSGDEGSTRSPLRLLDHEVIGPASIPDDGLSDDFDGGAVGTWSDCGGYTAVSCTECAGDHYLEATNCHWIEKGGTRMWIGPNVQDNNYDPIDPGTYRFTFRMRSPDTDAIRFGPEFQNPMYRQYQYLGLTPGWQTYHMVFTVEDDGADDYVISAFQNVRYSLGAQDASTVEIDFIEAKSCTLVTSYEEVIAADHILHFHDPLADEAYEPLELEGCWADVDNNIHTGTIALAPWESIVLYRLHDDLATLPLTSGEYHISGTEVWDTNRNVEGSIVVDNGGTLVIDGAIIGFVPSNGSLTTNVKVAAGGTLIVKNNGHLTSLPDCDDPEMWDGVIAPSGYATRPVIGLTTGAKISDAYTALLFVNKPPSDPLFNITANGARPDLTITDAWFMNNQHDMVLAPLSLVAPIPLLGATIRDSRFLTTRALNNPALKPKHHIYLAGVRNLPIAGCTFANTSGLDAGSPTLWGRGITASSSTPWILASEQQRSTFMNLYMGTTIATTITSGAAMVDEADFIGCAAGAYIRASDHATITRNTFQVPDVDISFTGVAAAYGAYMHGSSGFTFEENTFTGPGNGAEYPTVGAVFRGLGPESNVYYNNTFNAFTSSGGQSAGTIIMGNNDGPNQGDGLVIKCNDYSLISPNDFDVAFTGPNVKIGDAQGGDENAQDPAGNTFAPNCSGSQHFHNNEEDMAEFKYFHHLASSTTLQIVPECASDPIEVSGGGSWYEGTTHLYDKEEVCPSFLGLMQGMQGLFEEVSEAIEASNSVNSDPSAYAVKAAAIHRLTSLALRSGHEDALDTAMLVHAQAPLVTSPNVLAGLYMAQGQLEEARELVDAALEEDPEAVYWLVADLYLAKLEEDQDPLSSAGLVGVLSDLAATDQYGSAHAAAWLAAMGVDEPEEIILPYMGAKRYKEEPLPQQAPTMKVHPNPSQGLVHFTATVPGGVQGAVLRILDVTGQVVGEKRTTGDDHLLSWDLNMTAGTYHAALIVGDAVVGRTKFILIP